MTCNYTDCYQTCIHPAVCFVSFTLRMSPEIVTQRFYCAIHRYIAERACVEMPGEWFEVEQYGVAA